MIYDQDLELSDNQFWPILEISLMNMKEASDRRVSKIFSINLEFNESQRRVCLLMFFSLND